MTARPGRIFSCAIGGLRKIGLCTIIFATFSQPLSAGEKVQQVAVEPGLVLEHLRGPVTVIVTGNPFRYAWQVSVNQQIISQSAINSALTPNNIPTPPPATAPSPLKATFGDAPTAVSSPPAGEIQLQMLPNPVTQVRTAPTNTCKTFPRFDSVVRCIQNIRMQLDHTVTGNNSTLALGWRKICAAQLEYLALERRTDDVLQSVTFGNAEERFDADKRLRTLLGSGNLGPDEDICGPPDGKPATWESWTKNGMVRIPKRFELATVTSVNTAISHIMPYPSNDLAVISQELTGVAAVLKNYTPNRIDTESKADTQSAIAECTLASTNDPGQALQKLQNVLDASGKARSEALKASASATASNAVSISKKLSAAIIAYSKAFNSYQAAKTALAGANKVACQAALNLRNPANVGTAGQALFDRQSDEITQLQNDLAAYLPTSMFGQQYAASYQQLQFLQASVLHSVGVNRFYVTIPESCTGLFGGQRTTTISVQRFVGQVNTVIVDCPSRVFTSGGFAFSVIPQGSYTSISNNTALPQPPTNGPSPAPATIQQTSYSDVRPVPVVLLNVRPWAQEPDDNGLYFSFGVSANSSSQSTVLDYLVGISHSLSRSLIFTAGVSLSPENVPLPGFQPGQPYYQASSTTPTTTRQRIAPFLAITYGAH